MLFNSLAFLVFLPLIFGSYLLVPRQLRWVLLLAASYYFYMSWRWEYGLLILFTTTVNYIASHQLHACASARGKKLWLASAVTASLGVLFVFKYFNFFVDSMNALAGSSTLRGLDVLLPVGISFFTFQTLSYTIEVYRGAFKPVAHFGKFALYISFFPQLVAGPIERPQSLMPQMIRLPDPMPALFTSGLRLILWGMFKKVVIADRLAVYINPVFDSPDAYAGLTVALATFFFAIQIYCDFSGYSDIAIGSARLLGIRLMDNFNYPYTARSIREFWRRWHISLSTWFRDYVYIPLGGNRVNATRLKVNLMITFVISGLWHGANWTFIIWGAIHGGILLLELWLEPKALYKRIPGGLRMLSTFFVVCLAWIFFRANTVGDAGILIASLCELDAWLHPQIFIPGVMRIDTAYCLVWAPGLLILEWLWRQPGMKRRFHSFVAVRFAVYLALLVCMAVAGVYSDANAFIYFQF